MLAANLQIVTSDSFSSSHWFPPPQYHYCWDECRKNFGTFKNYLDSKNLKSKINLEGLILGTSVCVVLPKSPYYISSHTLLNF